MLEVASDPTAREILIAGGTQISPRSDVPKDSSDSAGDAPAGTDGVDARAFGAGGSSGRRPFVGGDGISRAARAIGGDDDAGSVAFRRASHRRDVHGHPSRVHPRLAANARRISEPRGGIFFTLVFSAGWPRPAGDRLAAEAAARDREIRSGYHGAGSAVLAALVVDILALRTPAATVYAVVLYHMMGLRRRRRRVFRLLGLLELFVVAAASQGGAVSLVARNPAVANLIATFTLLLSAMFGGFLSSASRAFPPRCVGCGGSPRTDTRGARCSPTRCERRFLFDTDFEGAAVEIEVDGQTYLNIFGLHPKTIARDAGALAGIVGGSGCWRISD